MRSLESETYSLFNRAFVAVLLASIARGYEDRAESGMPILLTFAAAPLVLNGRTRQQLPGNVRSRLTAWLASHQEAHAAFLQTAPAYVPHVRAGLRAGLHTGALERRGTLLHGVLNDAAEPSLDVQDCVRKAALVGRWFAISGTEATIFRVLGIRP